MFTAAAGVVACAPQVGLIYVAERNGAIVSQSGNVGGVKQEPGDTFITSMAYDGAHVALAWTQMAATGIAPGQVDARWQLRVDAGVNDFTFLTGPNPRLAMFNAAGDVYLLDDDGVVTSPL